MPCGRGGPAIAIRLRLVLILALATGIIWISAFAWIEHSTRGKVEHVLDARLAEAATMVSSLISDHRIEVAHAGRSPFPLPLPLHDHAEGYSRQLSCQIWSLDGTLVGRSDGAPDAQLTLTGGAGFSDSVVDGDPWRVFSVINEDIGVRILVGDSVAVRDRLVRDVREGLLLPAALILPVLGLMIWVSVSRGLAPLDRLAANLRARSPSDLSPLPDGPVPSEIRPMRAALDALFARVASARDIERDFTTYAAHELKTPLAGLRTQAQVARMARDAPTREAALRAIETSVDRTDRMVRQLLELAEVERMDLRRDPCDLAALLRDTIAGLAVLSAEGGVTVTARLDDPGPLADTNAFLLQSAARNVIENTILATPRGGSVTVDLQLAAGHHVVTVTDSGPGIPEALRARATDRFVRGPVGRSQGSGLGLAIVASAMDRLGGELVLVPGDGQGQRVDLRLPRSDEADQVPA